jgi:hypothetical protein
MKMTKLWVLAAAAGMLAIGCGSDDGPICGDGGVCTPSGDGGAGGSTLFPLSRGKTDFKITAVSNVNDGCMLGVDMLTEINKDPIPVTNDVVGTVSTVSVGNTQGSPVQASLGTGTVSNNVGTLTRDNTVQDKANAACDFRRKVTSNLQLIGQDKFTLTVKQEESMYKAACTGVPTGGTCTSTWTWTLEKR